MEQPSSHNAAIQFRFLKQPYVILSDNNAEDDEAHVIEQVALVFSGFSGTLLTNPHSDVLTFGLPFKGKDLYLVSGAVDRMRLDIWLSQQHPDTSRSTWQKHIKAGNVQVNGNVESSTKYDVTKNDTVTVSIPEKATFDEQTLPILYIDDNVIVIDKPAGILSHAKGALSDEFTVGEFFRRYSTYHADSNRPGIIHRLDRDTSGVMIGVRNEATALLLQRQFSDRKVKKTYLAVTKGHPQQDEAKIDLPIARNPSAPSTFRVDPKGKPAQTVYNVLQKSDKYSLVELMPTTGRTHQLRVHLTYLNTPIHGDKVYGKIAERMYLHAHKLEITIPTSQRMVFESPVPTEFYQFFEKE